MNQSVITSSLLKLLSRKKIKKDQWSKFKIEYLNEERNKRNKSHILRVIMVNGNNFKYNVKLKLKKLTTNKIRNRK